MSSPHMIDLTIRDPELILWYLEDRMNRTKRFVFTCIASNMLSLTVRDTGHIKSIDMTILMAAKHQNSAI